MVECFHAITIDPKHLYFYRCEPYCIIFPSRNKSFPRDPFKFLHIGESLVSRSLNVSSIEARGSSLEVQVSSVNLLLSGTVLPLTRNAKCPIHAKSVSGKGYQGFQTTGTLCLITNKFSLPVHTHVPVCMLT